MELLHGLARSAAFLSHLLRFVQDEDRIRRGKHVDRAATAEIIAFGEHDACRLVTTAPLALALRLIERVKRLHIDDHDRDVVPAGEAVELVQAAAVVDEPPDALAIALREMPFGDSERFRHTLANGNAWYHDDEFRPAVPLVELKDCLGIDVGFAWVPVPISTSSSHAPSA